MGFNALEMPYNRKDRSPPEGRPRSSTELSSGMDFSGAGPRASRGKGRRPADPKLWASVLRGTARAGSKLWALANTDLPPRDSTWLQAAGRNAFAGQPSGE